jgi:hypothetical protein
MALGLTQPLTEMSIRNIPGGKGRPARNADNITAICELDVSQSYGPSRPVTGIALPFFYKNGNTIFLYHTLKLYVYVHSFSVIRSFAVV